MIKLKWQFGWSLYTLCTILPTNLLNEWRNNVLVNLREILVDAKQKKYAILATNTFNFDSAEIIIDAAEEKKSPVILMVAKPLF